MRYGKCSAVVFMLALVWLLTGCGGDEAEQRDCGEGTVEQNGSCVAVDADVECGEGTIEIDGQCVAEGEPAGCGAGTQLIDGECVVADEGCATGTELDEDGYCVPTDAVCDAGTEFDAALQQCVPIDGLQCGEGTVESDGICEADAASAGCGAGTQLIDGECVVADEGCATGTELDEDGYCVPTDAACDEGTEFDAGTQKCVPVDGLACGEGTVESDGLCEVEESIGCGPGTQLIDEQCVVADEGCTAGTELDEDGYCVPTDEVCDEGTEFDGGAQQCVPVSMISCGAGTVEDDQVCVPELSFAEELAETAELDESQGSELDTPDVGEQFVFTGTISAVDEHDPEQHISSFEFDAQAGQWFDIGVYSLGLPEPAFVVQGPEGFERESAIGVSPSRYVAIPEDGEYTIHIMPSVVLADASAGPIGDSGWEFVASIEQLEFPAAETVDIEGDAVGGNVLELVDNLYEVNGAEQGEDMVVDLTQWGSNADGVIQIWSDDQTVVSSLEVDSPQRFTVTAPEDVFYLLVDFRAANGVHLNYELSIEELVVLDPGDVHEETVQVSAGEVLVIAHDNESAVSMDVSVEDASGEVLIDAVTTRALSGTFPQYRFWYSVEGGEYTVTLTSSFGSSASAFATHFDLVTPYDLGTLNQVGDTLDFSTNDTVEIERSRYFLMDVEDDLFLDGTVWAPEGEPRLYAHYTDPFDVLPDGDIAFDSTLNGGDELHFLESVEEGTYLVQILAWWELTDGFDLTIEAIDPPELFDWEQTLDVTAGEVIEIRQTNDGDASLLVSLERDGDLVIDEQPLASGQDVVRWYAASDDPYTVTVQEDGEPENLDVEVDVELNSAVDLGTLGSDVVYQYDGVVEEQRDFYLVVNVEELSLLDGSLTAPEGDPDLYIHDAHTMDVLLSSTVSGDESFADLSVEPGAWVIRVRAWSELEAGFTLELTRHDLISGDLGSLGVGDSLEQESTASLASGSYSYYAVELTESVQLSGFLSANGSGDPDFYLYEADDLENDIFSRAVPGDVTFSAGILDAGQYVVGIYAWSTLEDGYTVGLDAEAP